MGGRRVGECKRLRDTHAQLARGNPAEGLSRTLGTLVGSQEVVFEDRAGDVPVRKAEGDPKCIVRMNRNTL